MEGMFIRGALECFGDRQFSVLEAESATRTWGSSWNWNLKVEVDRGELATASAILLQTEVYITKSEYIPNDV
jgi:hypothetical protein